MPETIDLERVLVVDGYFCSDPLDYDLQPGVANPRRPGAIF